MNKPKDYPTTFKKADDDGVLQFIEMTVDEARKLIDEVSETTLAEGFDIAQGDASMTGKPHYIILRIRGED